MGVVLVARKGLSPLAGCAGAEDSSDHRHVFDCIPKGNRNLGAVQDRAGEGITLNRVLVADRESLGGDAAAEDIASVVDQNAGGPIRGSVERDLDLDASLRAKDVDSLVGHELRAAREDGLSQGKIEDG